MTERPADVQVLGDPRIPWVVLMDVGLADGPPVPDVLAEAVATIAADAGWLPPTADAVVSGARRDLLGMLCSKSADVLRVGVHQRGLVLAARHDALDGLGTLATLGRLLDQEVRSSARGVDPTHRAGRPVAALIGRAWEVAVQPPARVAQSVQSTALGDSFAALTIEGAPRTADLVYAGSRAIVTWNLRHNAPAGGVAVAVGVSTGGGSSGGLTDSSAFLRLRGVERMTRTEIGSWLAHGPLQLGGFDPALPRLLSAVAGVAFRVTARRLGSTLLVSHLGTIDAPESVDVPMFYPVTGGGSGLSLGAATMRGSTTLTLRSRATQHDDEGLQQLLALVVEEIGATVQ